MIMTMGRVSSVSDDGAKQIVVSMVSIRLNYCNAVVSIRLNYCNAVLFKMSQSNLSQLQRVQNSLAQSRGVLL